MPLCHFRSGLDVTALRVRTLYDSAALGPAINRSNLLSALIEPLEWFDLQIGEQFETVELAALKWFESFEQFA